MYYYNKNEIKEVFKFPHKIDRGVESILYESVNNLLLFS